MKKLHGKFTILFGLFFSFYGVIYGVHIFHLRASQSCCKVDKYTEGTLGPALAPPDEINLEQQSCQTSIKNVACSRNPTLLPHTHTNRAYKSSFGSIKISLRKFAHIWKVAGKSSVFAASGSSRVSVAWRAWRTPAPPNFRSASKYVSKIAKENSRLTA